MNEAVTINTLRTISQAQMLYHEANSGNYGTFEQLSAGGYLDSRFNGSNPSLYGYTLTMNLTPKSDASDSTFTCNADPAGNAQGRHFVVDSSGAIHVNATQPASVNDEVLK